VVECLLALPTDKHVHVPVIVVVPNRQWILRVHRARRDVKPLRRPSGSMPDEGRGLGGGGGEIAESTQHGVLLLGFSGRLLRLGGVAPHGVFGNRGFLGGFGH
jgi:hypothetical protein